MMLLERRLCRCKLCAMIWPLVHEILVALAPRLWAVVGATYLTRKRLQELAEGMGFEWREGRNNITPEVVKDETEAVASMVRREGQEGHGGQ